MKKEMKTSTIRKNIRQIRKKHINPVFKAEDYNQSIPYIKELCDELNRFVKIANVNGTPGVNLKDVDRQKKLFNVDIWFYSSRYSKGYKRQHTPQGFLASYNKITFENQEDIKYETKYSLFKNGKECNEPCIVYKKDSADGSLIDEKINVFDKKAWRYLNLHSGELRYCEGYRHYKQPTFRMEEKEFASEKRMKEFIKIFKESNDLLEKVFLNRIIEKPKRTKSKQEIKKSV